MITNKQIQEFLSKENKFVITGVSRNPNKTGRAIYDVMKEKGYNVVPVNPGADIIGNDKCFKNLGEVPVEYTHLISVVNRGLTNKIIETAIDKGIKNIWLQLTTDTERAIKKAEENNINIIYKQCFFMHAAPVKGIHKLHKGINKLLGKHPK